MTYREIYTYKTIQLVIRCWYNLIGNVMSLLGDRFLSLAAGCGATVVRTIACRLGFAIAGDTGGWEVLFVQFH
jgi:hypothetical protein